MCTNPKFISKVSFLVPCGKCMECCIEYSNKWTQRIMDEASLYEQNCMLTLTYAETDGILHKEDLQKFFKRLRARIAPHKIRYFACGEYGGKKNRPHFHAIIFNYFPPDAVVSVQKPNGEVYYSSEFIADVWSHGFISVSQLDRRRVKYCTKYLTKLDDRYHEVKPFTVMSRKPGLAFNVIDPSMLTTGVRYFDGKECAIPKYYIDKLEQNGYNVDIVKARRKQIAIAKAGEYIDLEDIKKLKKKHQAIEERMKL